MMSMLLTVFGLASLWMAMGRNERLRRWAPIVGLAGQPCWALFAWKAHVAGVDATGLAVLVVAYSAVYIRGAWVQFHGKHIHG